MCARSAGPLPTSTTTVWRPATPAVAVRLARLFDLLVARDVLRVGRALITSPSCGVFMSGSKIVIAEALGEKPGSWGRGTHATSDHTDFLQFAVVPDGPGDLELMDSCFASPARYVAELLMRSQELVPAAAAWIVLNARMGSAFTWTEKVVNAMTRAPPQSDAVVLSDAGGLAAGYLFRRRVARKDVLMLSALSALDARLDREFLNAAFGWNVALVTAAELAVGGAPHNGFLPKHFHEKAATLPAQIACSLRKGQHQVALQHMAVLPFHAGDVLFLCQVLASCRSVDSMMVMEDYAPIARLVLPEIDLLVDPGRTPFRPGWSPMNPGPFNEQENAFESVKNVYERMAGMGRPVRRIPHLLRTHRDYCTTRYHLRHAIAFALGASSQDAERVWSPAAAGRRTPKRGAVLVHFDAGWKLKSYPRRFRRALIQLLRSRGMSPTVLGSADADLGCECVPFPGAAALRDMLAWAEAFVGADSFPAHFAAHCGVPTLYLFGSTRPENACDGDGPTVRVLHNDLPCVPCQPGKCCALDGGEFCRALARPHEVVAGLEALLGGAAGFEGQRPSASIASPTLRVEGGQ